MYYPPKSNTKRLVLLMRAEGKSIYHIAQRLGITRVTATKYANEPPKALVLKPEEHIIGGDVQKALDDALDQLELTAKRSNKGNKDELRQIELDYKALAFERSQGKEKKPKTKKLIPAVPLLSKEEKKLQRVAAKAHQQEIQKYKDLVEEYTGKCEESKRYADFTAFKAEEKKTDTARALADKCYLTAKAQATYLDNLKDKLEKLKAEGVYQGEWKIYPKSQGEWTKLNKKGTWVNMNKEKKK
jgi:hypothetical protein